MRIFLFILILSVCGSTVFSQSNNDVKTKRFIKSNLYPKGEFEVHLFNNYYSQKDKLNQSSTFNSRYDFYTITTQFLIGINTKLNIGFDLNFRSVSQNTVSTEGKFSALKFKNEGFMSDGGNVTGYTRTGFSLFGPKIQYQVFPSLGSFSILHTLLLPIGKDLGGNQDTGYLDWGSPVLTNQIYYHKDIGSNWSLFAETGLFIENINGAMIKQDDGFYQFSIPSTAILSFYPTEKLTVYGLVSYAGRWENSVSNNAVDTNYNPYYQFGLGTKLWISKNIEAEFILTSFEDESPTRTASTFNLGFRYFSNR